MKDFSAPVNIHEKEGFEENCNWKVVINSQYQESFARAGFDSFKRFFDLQGGTLIKKIKDRSVVRLEISDTSFFLKRHAREKKQIQVQSQSSLISYCSEGGKEFANFFAFRKNGLATAIPVAMGEKIFSDGTVESFLLTEDFSPYVQLEYIIRNEPSQLEGQEKSKKRKDIMRAVASYARMMHEKGFNHQDFNATHVLLADVESELPKVALFDLQRVDQNRLQKFRWPIKALAEFNYSTLENGIFSDEERLFLFQIYKNRENSPLSLWDRFQWVWTQAKTKRIARHTAKRHARKRSSKGSISS